MENSDSIELEDSADVSDKNVEATYENKDYSDVHMQKFLTASEMFSLRENLFKNKGRDEDLELYKGPKFYHPSDLAASEEIVEDIMQSNKKSLELQRIAKNKDCLKAEWNEELRVAVVPHLKGKATQHMGSNMNGKCALSPEEALFLLEKGDIEVEYNKMPLSVEEAYSFMLKEKLSVEKYEVYSHLSQQGFIVVLHQSRIGPSYVNVMNLSKKKQRKRKADSSVKSSDKKRLTFTGVLASNSVNTESSMLSSDCLLENNEPSNNATFSSFSMLNNDQNTSDGNENIHLEVSNDDTVSSNCTNHISLNTSLEKDMSTSCSKEQTIENDTKMADISSKDDENCISADDKHFYEKKDETDKTVEAAAIECIKDGIETFDNSQKQDITDKAIKEATVKCIRDSDEIDVENIDDDEPHAENVDDDEPHAENVDDDEIDVENIKDTNEVVIEYTNEVVIEDEQRGNKSPDINVEDSCDDYDDNEESMSSDESIPVMYEGINEKSLDMYSCSPSGLQGNSDSNIEASDMHKRTSNDADEEVTLVRVKKKEKKPLAVIDLLSDDEDNVSLEDQNRAGSSGEELQNKTNGKEVFEDSDDEIQVLNVVGGTLNNNQVASRSMNFIKSESKPVLKQEPSVRKVEYTLKMSFPDAFRKDIICVPRPPDNFLPFSVQPAKEVYILNHEKTTRSGSAPGPGSGRLWNSYKDLQDYQRDRRRGRQRNSFNTRASGPFRNQGDSFSCAIPPFSSPEYSRNMSIESQNYLLPSQRNLYQPPNSERTGPLLPTPGRFNSPNQMPFSANIHNLQNLSSSNPAAFVNELQKTVYSVASNMISTILNQQFHTSNPPLAPSRFSDSNMMGFNPPHSYSDNLSMSPAMPGPMGYNSSGRNDFHPMRFPQDQTFSGERYPSPMGPFLSDPRQSNNFRQRNFPPRGPSFPCRYRTVQRKRDWNDIKAAVEGTKESDSGSDIEEVPINLNQFLFSNDIKPLIKPGSKLPIGDGLETLRITQMANLCDTKRCIDRCLLAVPTLEISFDVYLPNTKFRKSEPSVPNFRIIVVKTSDPIPRYSELVRLQRKWNDGASLQVAVVDHGDISFFSFNSITVPELIPYDS